MNTTNPNIAITYEEWALKEPLEMLDESKHYNSVDLVREINKLRKEINRLKK